ncbi:MAG TPA: MFS transporter, partial [Sphingomonas sp.]
MAGLTRTRLGVSRVIGFTVGDFAFNLYWQSISLYLLFFYTDAVGLSAGAAGLIYMIASIFDATIDPLMGAIADRTRTRWGRYRPYLLFGGPFVGIAFVLLYYKPALAGSSLAAWMLATHVLFRIAYTLVSIPYTAMSARITPNSGERGSIAGARIIFATLAGLTVAITTQPLAAHFGGVADSPHGYLIAAVLFAAVATVIFPIVFAATREPDDDVKEVVPHSLG